MAPLLRVLQPRSHPSSHCSPESIILLSFSRLQTKKLRRIDCNNRYCVWSIAHPQPVNLCQPCYCDKVRRRLALQSHLGPLKLYTTFLFSFQFQPHLPPCDHPALTQSPFFSILYARFFLFLPFPLPSFSPLTSDNQLISNISIPHSSSAPTQRKPSPRAHQSTARIVTIGTADLVSSAGASISSRGLSHVPFMPVVAPLLVSAAI